MQGIEEGVENFNVEDEEVAARDTIVQNPDLYRQEVSESPEISPEDERVYYVTEMYKQLQSCIPP